MAELDPTVEDLVELPRRVVKQPDTELNPGGDCGACVLAGLLGISIEEVYAKLHPEKRASDFGWHSMFEALRTARYDLGIVDRYISRTPMWPVDDAIRAWGDASWSQSLDWQEWLRMAFDAGYYAIAQVRAVHEPMQFETDHWVLYCGVRTKWDGPKGARRGGNYELLVSDSGRTKPHEKWFVVGDHLKQRGGFSVMLVRPRG